MVRQCELLSLCRSRIYYRPRPVSEADLRLMRHIDELHLSHPFFGARKLAECLRRERFDVGRRHAGTLMRRMRLGALYPKKRTSLPAPGHRINPYLLCGVTIEQPNEVWAADITYLPLARGFADLVAIVDLASRKVLAHRVSNTMAVDFCEAALEEALARYGNQESSTPTGQPIHRRGLHRCPGGLPRTHQHGRQAALDRQCVRRAVVAKREVRGPLLACLPEPERCCARAQALLRITRYPASASIARESNTRRGVLRNPRLKEAA